VDSTTGRLVCFILRAELLLPPPSPSPGPGCRERPAARLTHEQLDQAQVSLAREHHVVALRQTRRRSGRTAWPGSLVAGADPFGVQRQVVRVARVVVAGARAEPRVSLQKQSYTYASKTDLVNMHG
jgi:hypothetical protein